MTAPQTAQYAANNAFLLLIDNNDALARKAVAFYRHTQTLRTLMAEAKAADTESKEDTKGVTQDKNQTKDQLLAKMVRLTSLVFGFASEKNNTVLGNRVKNFTTTFGNAKQHDIKALCKDVLDKVKPFLPDLADYGVTAAMLDEIADLIDAYDGKVPAARTKSKEKTVSTKNRDTAFDKMTDLMDTQILPLAVFFQGEYQTFYDKLIAAAGVDATTAKPALLKVVLKNDTGTRTLHTMKARSLSSDKHFKANKKGEITLRFAKGGPKDIEIPIEGGEPIKLTGIETKNGKTKKVIVNL